MPNGFDFLLLALATWRLSAFLMWEEGPWKVARWLRERIGIVHDDEGRAVGHPDGTLGTMFSCIYCMSVWTGAALFGLWLSGPGVVLVLVLAISGGAVMVEAVSTRLNR